MATIHTLRTSDAEIVFLDLMNVRGAAKRMEILQKHVRSMLRNGPKAKVKVEKLEMQRVIDELRRKNKRLASKFDGFKAKNEDKDLTKRRRADQFFKWKVVKDVFEAHGVCEDLRAY